MTPSKVAMGAAKEIAKLVEDENDGRITVPPMGIESFASIIDEHIKPAVDNIWGVLETAHPGLRCPRCGNTNPAIGDGGCRCCHTDTLTQPIETIEVTRDELADALRKALEGAKK